MAAAQLQLTNYTYSLLYTYLYIYTCVYYTTGNLQVCIYISIWNDFHIDRTAPHKRIYSDLKRSSILNWTRPPRNKFTKLTSHRCYILYIDGRDGQQHLTG